MAAVLEALRNYTRPDALFGSPLLYSRLVTDRAGLHAKKAQRIETMQALLREACETLQASPREAKLARAVHHTYIQPAPTQELAADLLDVPFSTYRRHLKEGLARVAEVLWRWETA